MIEFVSLVAQATIALPDPAVAAKAAEAARAAAAAAAQAKVIGDRLAVLASPTEVAIGIAVAYLGFDRFRFATRIGERARAASRNIMSLDAAFKLAIADGKIDNDEKSLLTLFYYGGSADERGFLRNHRDKLAKHHFFNSNCARLMWFFAQAQMDRWLVLVATLLLGAWVLFTTFALVAFGGLPAWFGQPWVGTSYFAIICTTMLVPCASYVLSAWMFADIDKNVRQLVASLTLNMQRRAEQAMVAAVQMPAANATESELAVQPTVLAAGTSPQSDA